MRKLFLFVIAVLLSVGVAFAQTGGDKTTLNPQPLPPGRHPATMSKTKKGHKGGKKGTRHKKSTVTTDVKPGRPGVPPPTRPTDPK